MMPPFIGQLVSNAFTLKYTGSVIIIRAKICIENIKKNYFKVHLYLGVVLMPLRPSSKNKLNQAKGLKNKLWILVLVCALSYQVV